MPRQPPKAPEPRTGQGSYQLRRKNPWVAFINLGALIAGVTVGYFFRKMEEEFTRYGEGLMIKVLRGFRGNGKNSDADRNSAHRRRYDSDDPLAEGYDFDDDDDRM